MKNKVKLLFLLLLFVYSGQAQVKEGIKGGVISFTKTSHQFGRIKEQSADVHVEFDFINNGAGDLTISDVTAERGVEIISWPKAAIQSGATGKIVTVFHPKGNPNAINKKITVLSNSTKNPKTTLTISGNVVPIPGSIADKYRRNIGSTALMVKNTSVNFGNVSNKVIQNKSLEIYNNSNESMTITFKDVPKHMSVVANPVVLLPKQQGNIVIDYKAGANKSNDGKQKWGAQNNRFSVVVNNDIKNSNRNSISVRVSIVEDFDNLTEEELAKAPKIEFENKVFNFGTINQGEVVKHDYVYTNLGDADLEIRYVKAT